MQLPTLSLLAVALLTSTVLANPIANPAAPPKVGVKAPATPAKVAGAHYISYDKAGCKVGGGQEVKKLSGDMTKGCHSLDSSVKSFDYSSGPTATNVKMYVQPGCKGAEQTVTLPAGKSGCHEVKQIQSFELA